MASGRGSVGGVGYALTDMAALPCAGPSRASGRRTGLAGHHVSAQSVCVSIGLACSHGAMRSSRWPAIEHWVLATCSARNSWLSCSARTKSTGGGGGGGVGVGGSLVVAERGEDLHEGGVLSPAGRDDPWLEGEPADEVA